MYPKKVRLKRAVEQPCLSWSFIRGNLPQCASYLSKEYVCVCRYECICVDVCVYVCWCVCVCGVPIVQKLHKRTLETDRLHFKPRSITC